MAAGAGSLAFAGGACTTSKSEGWLFAVGAKGALQWSNKVVGHRHAIDAVHVTPGGDLVAGGWKMVNGETGAWLGRFSPAGR